MVKLKVDDMGRVGGLDESHTLLVVEVFKGVVNTREAPSGVCVGRVFTRPYTVVGSCKSWKLMHMI